MNAFALGGIVATSLILLTAIALLSRKNKSTNTCDRIWLRQHGWPVMATMTNIQSKQDWKYGERWHRSTWNGNLERERTWQTYYDVTLEWVHPATKQVHTFHWHVWANERTCPPTRGEELRILLDPERPDHYAVDVSTAEQLFSALG